MLPSLIPSNTSTCKFLYVLKSHNSNSSNKYVTGLFSKQLTFKNQWVSFSPSCSGHLPDSDLAYSVWGALRWTDDWA